MYIVKTTSGDSEFILRPELTASVVRIAQEQNWKHKLPQKVWYEGPLFSHEKPQKGRYRQFYQLGVEFIGAKEGESELEVMLLAKNILSALDLSQDQYEVTYTKLRSK